MVVFVLSSLIVVGYCYLTFGVQPPTVGGPQPPTGVEESPGQSAPIDSVQVETDPVPVRREQVYTCLIFGLDSSSGSTDTIMVATFDVPNQKIGLISIPRDTVVRLDRTQPWNKINAAYADGGVEQMDKELEQLLGFPIDYYVKIRLSAFKKLVNAVGGVWYDVPFDMYYDDPLQDLHIHISKGYQLLNGEQAMGLVRFRQFNNKEGYGDTGRANTQQAFIKAMLNQVLSGASLESIPGMVDILLNYVETNAGLNDMLYFGNALVGMDLNGAISTETLPAQWKSPYMWVEEEQALTVINELLNPYTTEITQDMVEFFKR